MSCFKRIKTRFLFGYVDKYGKTLFSWNYCKKAIKCFWAPVWAIHVRAHFVVPKTISACFINFLGSRFRQSNQLFFWDKITCFSDLFDKKSLRIFTWWSMDLKWYVSTRSFALSPCYYSVIKVSRVIEAISKMVFLAAVLESKYV